MGIINSRYNKLKQARTARFCCLETWKDKDVVHALLHSVETWARQNGMEKIIGPYGFSDQDPEGFLIDGFENRATIATYYNFAWLPQFVEQKGYSKEIDYFVYKIKVPEKPSPLHLRICERVLQRGNFKVQEARNRRDLKKWVKPVLELMNECYSNSDIFGYTPLDEEEMENLAKRYFPFLNHNFVKLVTLDNKPVAFIIAIPDMTEGIQKARGRLFPFGWLKILQAARKTKQIDLLLGGVKEGYRQAGLDILLLTRMIAAAHEARLEVVDTHHQMETNIKVRALSKKLGGEVYKRYRVYQKGL
ncbi:MAG: hypothetical protein L3J03_08350 [Desulfobacterales bacterium]|nr:hypothetical protein [Desulfobacterales bacterium]